MTQGVSSLSLCVSNIVMNKRDGRFNALEVVRIYFEHCFIISIVNLNFLRRATCDALRAHKGLNELSGHD